MVNTHDGQEKSAMLPARCEKPSDLMAYMKRAESQIASALPRHITPERMMRLALTCFSSNKDLRTCHPLSIISSIVIASQLGLEPGIQGQGYLIPYKGVCTFVPGWQGLVGLLNNTGRATAWTGAVFNGDTFEFELGSCPKCRHIPGPNYGEEDQLTGAYACAKVNGSEQPIIEWWPADRILRHRDKHNKVGNKHYSFRHPEMYARKVVLLQVLKYVPKSIELQNAISAADAAEMGRAIKIEDGIVIDAETFETPADTSAAPDPFVNRGGGLAKEAPQGDEPETLL